MRGTTCIRPRNGRTLLRKQPSRALPTFYNACQHAESYFYMFRNGTPTLLRRSPFAVLSAFEDTALFERGENAYYSSSQFFKYKITWYTITRASFFVNIFYERLSFFAWFFDNKNAATPAKVSPRLLKFYFNDFFLPRSCAHARQNTDINERTAKTPRLSLPPVGGFL